MRLLPFVALALVAAVAAASAGALAKRPDTIVGTAKTECGRAVGSFTVRAQGYDGHVNLGGDSIPSLGLVHGHGGVYSLTTLDTVAHRRPVNALVRDVTAETTLSYRGHKYTLPLYPKDGKPGGTAPGDYKGYSGKGLERDFVLKTSGLRPGFGPYAKYMTAFDDTGAGAFYGANLILALSLGDVSGPLTVTLTPQGPLADGCPAKPVVRQITVGQYQGDAYLYLHSIPLAAYTMSAQIGGRTLQLNLNGSATKSAALPVEFLPFDGHLDGGGAVTVDAG